MSSLYEIQHAFQNHLRGADPDILRYLKLPDQGLIEDRLAVYANGYRWRLIDALQREYAVLLAYLGEEAFTDCADDFMDTHPSRYYSINDFARQFPEFLAHTVSVEYGYHVELAKLCRALNQSMEVADASILHQKALQSLSSEQWPALCFTLHPSVQILDFQWNTFELWKTWVQEKKLFKPVFQRTHCIVWRKELQSYAHRLTSVEQNLLGAIQKGDCFAQLCEAIYQEGLTEENEAAIQVAQCLTRWLSNHLFSEAYIP